MNKLNVNQIAIIGLGYVGLPLAVEFAKKYPVIGYDINETRIRELRDGNDSTREVDFESLNSVLNANNSDFNRLRVTTDEEMLLECNVYVVTVPTPIDKHNRPVLTPMLLASETVGKYLKKNDIVIYESTVYPGVTEDECVPVLENISGLVYNKDFYVGYSPERINPGDKLHTVTTIRKITSGSTPDAADKVDQLYKSIITAGTYKASSIKVAEAAKVIENSQRDINIAFVNELSKIFNLLKIDTTEVLAAASTKWNFLNFKPGLVGGHCIGVDPYYLAQKAIEVGYHPEIILAGRRTNDSMGKYVAEEVIKKMVLKNISINNSRVLILGFTFKENCPDIRNTRVVDIYKELQNLCMKVDIYDPLANREEVLNEYNIDIFTQKEQVDFKNYSVIILAVAHTEFSKIEFSKCNNVVLYDIKGILPAHLVDGRL